MIPKIKNKGMVYTLGLGMLALTILALSTTTLLYRQKMQDLNYNTAAIERTYFTFNSAGEDLRGILLETSGINVSVNGATITFKETLPNSHVSTYQNALDTYSEFAIENSDILGLDLDMLRNITTLTIQPNGINYTHDYLGGRRVQVNPSTVNFDKYSLHIETSENITGCQWDIPGSNETIELAIAVTGPSGGCSNTVHPGTATTSSISINGGAMSITVNPGGKLTVVSNFATETNISTSIHIYLLDEPNNLIGIYLPYGIISTNLPDHEIIKRGIARIY